MTVTVGPVDAAGRVARSMAELKNATRGLGDPADAVWILGSVQAASISLMLTLQNLAAFLQDTATTPGDAAHLTPASRALAMHAAERLETATREQTRAFAALIEASDGLSKVEWDPDAPPPPSDCRPATGVTALRRNTEIRSDAIGPTL